MANFAYIINIGNYNAFFNSATFDKLELNQTYILDLFTMDNVSPMYLQTANIEPINFDTSGFKTIGYRLTEISAFSLFNSATARAALANKAEYIYGTNTDFSNSIITSMNTLFTSEISNIYNIYTILPQYNVNSNQFNFSGMNFAFNYYHTGHTIGINRGHNYYGPIAGKTNSFNHQILFLLTEQ